MTLAEIKMKKLNPEDYFLPTGFGAKRIAGITEDWWVIIGRNLSRRSFHCTPQTTVYTTAEEADKEIIDGNMILKKLFEIERSLL